MSSHNNIRLDYLDAVRGFALILGIVFHASLSFMPIFIGWAVMDISTSELVPLFLMISHSFRMALFFLVAGFFSHMAFHQHGVKSFFKSRLIRIGIPFLIGWFILRPLLVSGWAMGAESMRGEANIMDALSIGFKSLGELPKDLFIGTHLWFLYYLILISSSVLAFRYLITIHEPMKSRLTSLADRVISWICASPFAILTVSIPTSICLWFMTHWGIDTPDKSLIPEVPVLLLYGGFFLFGWLLHRQSILMQKFASLTFSRALFCAFSIIVACVLSSFEAQTGHPQYPLIKACFLLNSAIMMWSLISLIIGLSKQIFNRPNKVVRYIADSSYWLYLIHLPIVIWLQVAFAELPFHWSIKLALISAITISVSILLYDLFVRATWVGTILNGNRKPRILHIPREKKAPHT